jgi:trehalose 6-phosphate phosphatase
VLLDFDGTLSSIVARQEDAVAVEGVREALAELVDRFRVVAVISGRTSEELLRLVDVPGLRYVGVYGMEGAAPDLVDAAAPLVERAAADVPAAWVEHKTASIAVHYRQAPDPDAARAILLPPLEAIASASGLEVLEGKMVIELVPAGRPRKGGAVRRLVGEHDLRAAVFAGDDLADLDAYAALERLSADPTFLAIKVAVRGAETPPELTDRADLVVDGPIGLVGLLRQLAV